jgi:hypothetical protein
LFKESKVYTKLKLEIAFGRGRLGSGDADEGLVKEWMLK